MLITNASILTFENSKIIQNGYVRIINGLIDSVGAGNFTSDLEENEEVIDACGKILMPGFICTHSHIYSAFARGMDIKGGSTRNFLEILENLWWRLDKKLTHEDIYYSALVTLIDCIKNGVTCLFDHHASPYAVEGSLDTIEKAFNLLGMRGTLCYEVSDRDGKEIASKGIEENLRFIRKSTIDKSDMVKGLFGLHASFTLSDETLSLCADAMEEADTGFHIHVAEGPEDLKHSQEKYGTGVVERLKNNKIMNSKSIFAHCIHINDREREMLREAMVVHNPESNMNNAVGYCDVDTLMEKGVLVGLGSDGFSSNHLRAIDTCYVLHKHQNQNPNAMNPGQLVDIAIRNNGLIASKFFEQELGVIKVGAKGDVILIDYKSPTPLTAANMDGHIVFGMNSNQITHTIINGRTIMKDRKLVEVDEEVIFENSRALAAKLWERF